jgi:hypothetical protein
MSLWLTLVVIGVACAICFVIGYFLGRNDERKWNLFFYQYGHFYGVRQERRKHR